MAFNAKADAAEKRALAAKLLQQAADEDKVTTQEVGTPVVVAPVVTNEATIAGDNRSTAQPSLLQTIMSVARRFR